MQHNLANFRKATLLPALLATSLLASCSGGDTNDAATAVASSDTSSQASPSIVNAVTDFEGTMQHMVVSLDADAISAVVGSSDLETVLAFPPERVIEAVLAGDVEAESFDRSTLEIDGRMGRMQVEGDASYTILDGEQMAALVVDAENSMIITMSSAKMAAAAGEDEDAGPIDLGAKEIGEREVRGFDATGYRFEFMDNIATAWLSEELEAQTGPIFDVWSQLNPMGQMLEVGEGAPVITVMVNPEALAGGSSFMPAYTVTEFYDLKAGDIADERFVLPEGYQQLDMANMGRGAQ